MANDLMPANKTGWWAERQPRERLLIIGAAIALVVFGFYGAFKALDNRLAAKLKETEEYRKALVYVAETRDTYQKNIAHNEETRNRLKAADGKIVNRLTTMASGLGLDVSIKPKDAKTLSDESGTEETEIEVQLKGVDYDKVLDYIIQIHKLDAPVYIRSLTMNRSGRASEKETKMSVNITLMSYRLK